MASFFGSGGTGGFKAFQFFSTTFHRGLTPPSTSFLLVLLPPPPFTNILLLLLLPPPRTLIFFPPLLLPLPSFYLSLPPPPLSPSPALHSPTPFPPPLPPPPLPCRRLLKPITSVALLSSSLILPTWVNCVSCILPPCVPSCTVTLPLSLLWLLRLAHYETPSRSVSLQPSSSLLFFSLLSATPPPSAL